MEDAKNIYFYGYKEPFSKFEGGYGYRGVVAQSRDTDKIQCHICGEFFISLSGCHLKTHGLTAKKYKKLVGLSSKTALISEGTRTALVARKKNSLTTEQRRAYGLKGLAIAQQNRYKQISLEERNKRGTCPDQLLDRIKKLKIEIGQTPTITDYDKKYGGHTIIYKTFGSWTKAVELSGSVPVRKKARNRYSREDLLDYLKLFYKNNGRAGSWSDCRRGLLPPYWKYSRTFGNMLIATAEAGIAVVK